MKTLLAALLPALAFAAAGPAQGAPGAEDRPFLSPMFTSNMVLQRGMADPVWGWTDPGSKVTVEINGKTSRATAGPDGKWLAKVGPLPVGGPYTLTVSGPQTVKLDNVLSGDVWICSGQSNMEMGIGNVNRAQEEIAAANYPQIRLFTVTKFIATEPRTSLTGKWDVCTPQTVAAGGWNGFSAVGYFFGRELNNRLKVPIGLIHTSWGGTVAEAWTSAEALNTMADFQPAVAQVREMNANRSSDSMEKRMADWYAHNDRGSAENAWAAVDFDAASWKTMNLPQAWEDAGLPDYDGIVWFRREVDIPADAAGKAVTLHLGPIDDQDTVWINGRQVGAHGEYLAPRDYRVPAGVLKEGRNVIAVRVLDTGVTGGFYGKPEQMFLEVPGGASISLAGPWSYRDSVKLASATPLPVSVSNNPNIATVLYNGMIAPVIPYGIRGAIWYQGESNAGRAYQYRTLLPTMIKDWRSRWNEGNFPFYIVQLANFTPVNAQPVESDWAELREAQAMTAASLPHSGEAVIIDIGEAADIHPKNKQDVGKRLALIALADSYGEKLEYSGPVYKSMKRDGNMIHLRFNHAEGLTAKGGKLQGFAIAGEDRKFVWADATIDGDMVMVSSPQVPHPVAVRYAWSNNPTCNLYNAAGLPASPFRTDDWPGVTAGRK